MKTLTKAQAQIVEASWIDEDWRDYANGDIEFLEHKVAATRKKVAKMTRPSWGDVIVAARSMRRSAAFDCDYGEILFIVACADGILHKPEIADDQVRFWIADQV